MNISNLPLPSRLLTFHQGCYSRQKLQEIWREAYKSKCCTSWASMRHLMNAGISQTARTGPGRVCHWQKSQDLMYFWPGVYDLYAVLEAAEPLTWSEASPFLRHRGNACPCLCASPPIRLGELSSNRDLLISPNFWHRMMEQSSLKGRRKETNGLYTPGLFLDKATFSIFALKLTHIHLIPVV